MKFCFIINPKSGKERFNPLIRRLKALLERDSLAYEFQITTKPGHATALAEKATASGLFDRIVAIGGDGTINEVVNGMIRVCMQDKDRPGNYPALGIIPANLGNDTARGARDSTWAKGCLHCSDTRFDSIHRCRDGESYYNNQFSIRLLPKALKIVAPYPKSLVSG
ncbi:MAG: acylglycerol kinase family protein [Deltaproteobacteria bacterium]|jgi:diacylglycerol kinase family enzyme|nr:acylglycerol kinase family protein [Deltaproteobacteria bacterium]MDL1986453.1 acylglycerol kinase family protein [Deltaproteobacteria bacterium]